MNRKAKPNPIFLLTFAALVAVLAINVAPAQWATKVVDPGALLVGSESLAYDPAGNPAIVYNGSDGVNFAHWNGESWIIEIVGAGGGGNSLAYDSGGNATVTYTTNAGLCFASNESGAWVSELVDEGASGSGLFASLAYDHSGNPSMCYKGNAKHPHRLYLKFARKNGSSWDIQIIGEDEVDGLTSLGYDSSGNAAIAYSSNGRLKLARNNGSSWDIEIVENVSTEVACLAFDPMTSYPSIAYGPWGSIQLASWNGTSWQSEEIVAGGYYPSFVYNSAGTPFVSYKDSEGLKVAQKNGSSWETEIVDWAEVAFIAPIAIDPAGNPAVSYLDIDTDNPGLKFAWCDPSNAPPTVNITSPANDSMFPDGDTIPIVFTGTAIDTEDGDLAASLAWTSDINGPIGSGSNFSTTLSTGRHVITASVTDSGGRTGSDSVSIIVGQPTTSTLYVEDIAMDWGMADKNYYALTTVWIMDDAIADVEGATVYGQWSGAVSGTASGVTGADGKVTLQSPKKKDGGTFTFTVTDVVASGYTYDEGLNAETEDSITVP